MSVHDEAMDLMGQGVCTLMGLETALAAIKAAQVLPGAPGWRPVATLPARETRMLSEAEGKALLSAAGVAVPRAVTGGTLAEVTKAAAGLTAPFALKGLGFAHKTEAGAVRLGLTSLDRQSEMPGATGYLLEEMVTGAVGEISVGSAPRSGLRRQSDFGHGRDCGRGSG